MTTLGVPLRRRPIIDNAVQWPSHGVAMLEHNFDLFGGAFKSRTGVCVVALASTCVRPGPLSVRGDLSVAPVTSPGVPTNFLDVF